MKSDLKHAAAILGGKGGAATGPRKARDPEHYRRIGKLGAAARAATLAARKAAKKPKKK